VVVFLVNGIRRLVAKLLSAPGAFVLEVDTTRRRSPSAVTLDIIPSPAEPAGDGVSSGSGLFCIAPGLVPDVAVSASASREPRVERLVPLDIAVVAKALGLEDSGLDSGSAYFLYVDEDDALERGEFRGEAEVAIDCEAALSCEWIRVTTGIAFDVVAAWVLSD